VTRSDDGQAPARAWQRMLSGRRLDLLNPAPADIEIEDIAHGLARVARWNGQTVGAHALSVAQHALIVEDITIACNGDWPMQWRLAALLHDAPEYVVGDLISPFKIAIGLDYKAFELRLLAAIHARFAIPVELPSNVQSEIRSPIASRPISRHPVWQASAPRRQGFTLASPGACPRPLRQL